MYRIYFVKEMIENLTQNGLEIEYRFKTKLFESEIIISKALQKTESNSELLQKTEFKPEININDTPQTNKNSLNKPTTKNSTNFDENDENREYCKWIFNDK